MCGRLVLRGVHGAPVVSALTVQDARGVRTVEAVDLAAAVSAVLETMPVRAVKIGMLAEGQAAVLARLLPALPIVLDPVLEASAGGTLAEANAYAEILERVTVVTPNANEIGVLGDAPEAWVERTGVSVLLKGGHGDGREVVDRLLVPRCAHRACGVTPRLDVRNTRGTGCTLASAIAAGLALGESLTQATEEALGLVDRLLRRLGRGGDRPGARPVAPPPRLAPFHSSPLACEREVARSAGGGADRRGRQSRRALPAPFRHSRIARPPRAARSSRARAT
jgi:hydroxymethylpyrimidine/phosphomethylpyrimidine kinase